jgi:UDP-glucose 4-epimerase
MLRQLWQWAAMSARGKVIVVGGQSSLGLALRQDYLPEATYVVRRPGRSGDLVVSDYITLSKEDLAGFSTLINCAGATSGSVAELTRANVELPSVVVRAARDAGLSRFVHVSSFSVYGFAEQITAATATAPVSDYGQSKLAGDQAILAMADERFRPVVVRFPAIVDGRRPRGKVAQLLRAWSRLRLLPMPVNDVRRSMISASLAARVLAEVATAPPAPVILAADEECFAYGSLARKLGHDLNRRFGVMPLPGVVLAPLRRTMPGVYASMFGNSVLESSSNFAAAMPSDLYSTLVELTKTIARA